MATKKLEVGEAGRTVASNVRSMRRALDLTLDDLSARLEAQGRPMSRATLSQIETLNRRVDVDDLVALARALDAPLVDLLPETGEYEEMNEWRRLTPAEKGRSIEDFDILSAVDQMRTALDVITQKVIKG
ncbi:helix-turn-helix transcriptional regulator [Diaminobutyricimonas sp. TR449]|uniref:helix-turn-helix domain-containing protein n=1 Tax=Diaminobutyricimonas sp. TR449 TaxID=2708076 RepID=UPI001421F657|nr:helix-turn-helix transcriptional regulator [Diaminobutyricimonas sp. TR449]